MAIKTTIDDLAGMVKRGFDGVDKQFSFPPQTPERKLGDGVRTRIPVAMLK